MAQYAIAFDLDTKAMKAAGFTDSDITKVYQREIPEALRGCGFTERPQGSLYHTDDSQDQITALMRLQGALKTHAKTFCAYVRKVHVFRMEEWSDVTPLIAERPIDGAPMPEDDVLQQDFFSNLN